MLWEDPRKALGTGVGGEEHVSLGCPTGVSANVLSLSPSWSWGVPCLGMPETLAGGAACVTLTFLSYGVDVIMALEPPV